MDMALRWWPFCRQPSPADDPEAREQQHRLRHDYLNQLNKISVKTEEARQAMDAVEAHVEYLKASAEDWEPHDDDAGRSVDPGVGDRPDHGV